MCGWVRGCVCVCAGVTGCVRCVRGGVCVDEVRATLFLVLGML